MTPEPALGDGKIEAGPLECRQGYGDRVGENRQRNVEHETVASTIISRTPGAFDRI